MIKESEGVAGGKLKHLDHPEDFVFHEGQHGLHRAIESLRSVAEGRSEVTQKVDGAPSIVVGHATNPRTGKHEPFVATKSAFNKEPKLNFTPEDIDENHGHAPGLVDKLKAALAHVHKIVPKDGTIYQGDMMYTKEDLQKNEQTGSTTFTPNTISYTAHGDEANKINNSKMGVVFHTKYEGKGDLASRSAEPMTREDVSRFSEHPDVWMRGAHMNNAPLPEDKRKQFEEHIKLAHALGKKGGDKMFNATKIHQGSGGHLSTYFNSCVRDGTDPSALGFRDYVSNKMQKEVDKAKSDAGKSKKTAEMQFHKNHIEGNLEHYENMFKIHKHLQDAKHIIVDHLNSTKSDIDHHIDGKETDPEGYVGNTPHRMIKLIKRKAFSALNFAKGKIGAAIAARREGNE